MVQSVLDTTNILNAGFSRNVNSGQNSEQTPNAFGIGRENQPEVELSPQARILQQNEQNQRQLANGLQEQREQAEQERREQEESQPEEADGFVRLSSSEGNVSRSNLEAERVAEVYRSIQRLG